MPSEQATLQLAKALIERPSITPDDSGCQKLLIERLKALNFRIQPLPFGEVSNFWAIRGKHKPTLVFAGHTDVVPPGDTDQWDSPPFQPSVRDNYLYGRGAVDMKGALAAMITACERFIAQFPNHPGSIGFLITSDEEGPAEHGTAKVVKYLQQQGIFFDYCLIGEPTSSKQLGDTLKIGRRGSLHARLRLVGKQGHVAYPELAINPIHQAVAVLHDMTAQQWDMGNESFPPTTFQITNIQSGTGATNVIPAYLECDVNFRFSTESTPEQLQLQLEVILKKHHLNYTLSWHLSGMPFLTTAHTLRDACNRAVQEVLSTEPSFSTTGGTSDGRFLTEMCPEIVELGLINATIHSTNECVAIADLEKLSCIYERLLQLILT